MRWNCPTTPEPGDCSLLHRSTTPCCTTQSATPGLLDHHHPCQIHGPLGQHGYLRRAFDKHAQINNFSLHQQVLVRVHDFLNKNRKLATKFEGPYKIVELFDNYAVLTGKNVKRITSASKETFCISSHSSPHRCHTLPSLGQRSWNRGREMVRSKHLTMRKSQTPRWQR